MIDKNGIPMYFTKENATKIGGVFEKRKVEMFETLQKTLTKEQVIKKLKTSKNSTISAPRNEHNRLCSNDREAAAFYVRSAIALQ
jgi:hypothetical protein